MSVELPEAKILAKQMSKELLGKQVKSIHLQHYEKLQKIGMLNKDIKAFDQLIDGIVESTTSRGNGIRLKLNNGVNLILAPEYGGRVFFRKRKEDITGKFHLKVDFADGSALTVRLTSMGLIHVIRDDALEHSYIFRRDFNPDVPSPIDPEFTSERFVELLSGKNRMLKSVLVGKDAIVVGLSNSAFQDIIYRARLHPKRKAAELTKEEAQALYDALTFVLLERIRLGGKDKFLDLYGNRGSYTPAMGPNMKQSTCKICETSIEKLSLGGGHTYLCPKCQK
jgi:formamidopyrimidine-DNA glycosylase